MKIAIPVITGNGMAAASELAERLPGSEVFNLKGKG